MKLLETMTEAITTELLSQVLAHYGYNIANCKISALGNGLINTTFLVKIADKSLVLQRLNQSVFKSPQLVLNNADLISKHLKTKVNLKQYALTPIWQYQTLAHTNHAKVAGEFWRCLYYVPDSQTIKKITNTEQARIVATAFAQFNAALSDFNSDRLAIIIPDFHHLPARLAQLNDAMENADPVRLTLAKSLVDFCLCQQTFIDSVANTIATLPIRVTHNDTKINNLLFSSTSAQPISVIDLDTCMPGYLMHDFGDMVRTSCSSLAEDDSNIDSMTINSDIFSALANAYISAFAGELSTAEQQSLLVGARLMPFMIGMRFLTDFLNNDKYFHTQYLEHNLVRAKNQLQMFKLLCKLDLELLVNTQQREAINDTI
jgi:Ser/Thr protein kinase RdoA (MazF antagonist)